MDNEFQEYVIEMFVATLRMCKEKNISKNVFLSYGSNHALKKGLITHFASMYKYHAEFKNLWQNSQIKFCEPLLMSENAYNIIQKVKSDQYNGSYNKFKKENSSNECRLYWEHITPNNVIWERLCNVYDAYVSNRISDNILRQKITNCFYGHKLLLITKAEELLLDRFGGRTGEKIMAVCNNDDIAFHNVAEQRINLLFERCNVKYLYLNNQKFEKNRILDSNCNFIDSVKDYFTNDNFTIHD